MNDETVENTLCELREGDEAIAATLGALDERLQTWLAAMRAGQAAVVDGLRQVESPVTGPNERVAPEPVPDVPPTDVSAAPETVPDAPPTTEPVADAVDEPEPAASGIKAPVDVPDAVLGDVLDDVLDEAVALFQSPVLPADAATGTEVPRTPASRQEDEALLAELDSETATLIRVKRRLSNTPRSVRELLDEVRAEQSRTESEKKETSRWWRRK